MIKFPFLTLTIQLTFLKVTDNYNILPNFSVVVVGPWPVWGCVCTANRGCNAVYKRSQVHGTDHQVTGNTASEYLFEGVFVQPIEAAMQYINDPKFMERTTKLQGTQPVSINGLSFLVICQNFLYSTACSSVLENLQNINSNIKEQPRLSHILTQVSISIFGEYGGSSV